MTWLTSVFNSIKAGAIQFWGHLKSASATVWTKIKSLWSHSSTPRKWIGGLILVALGVVVTKLVTDAVEPPYVLSVQSNPDLMTTKGGFVGDSAAYVIPRTPDQIGPPPIDGDVCTDRNVWAHAQGGVDANATSVDVTVTGNNSDVTRIVGLETILVDRAAPMFGNLIACPGGGEESTVRPVNINLDADPPKYTMTDGDGEKIPFAFEVTQGGSETFRITANANDCDCKWQAVLVLEVNGETIREVIPANGGFFQTTGSSNTTRYQWINGTWTTGDTGPQPPKGIKDIPDSCTLATEADLSAAVGASIAPATRPAGIPAVGYGTGTSGQDMYISTCDFRAPSDAGQLAFLQLEGFAGSGAAEGEYDAISANYRTGETTGRELTIMGADEAIQFGDTLVIRSGRLVLNLQVSPEPTQATFIDIGQKAVIAAGA